MPDVVPLIAKPCSHCPGIARLRREIKEPKGQSGMSGQDDIVIERLNFIRPCQFECCSLAFFSLMFTPDLTRNSTISLSFFVAAQ